MTTKDKRPKTKLRSPALIKPILTMRILPNPESHNFYGFKRVDVIQFNYDGKGSALLRIDNRNELEAFYGEDLYMILMGDPSSGVRWYRPE